MDTSQWQKGHTNLIHIIDSCWCHYFQEEYLDINKKNVYQKPRNRDCLCLIVDYYEKGRELRKKKLTDICNALDIDGGTFNDAANNFFIPDGYIKIDIHENDKRVKLVKPTQKLYEKVKNYQKILISTIYYDYIKILNQSEEIEYINNDEVFKRIGKDGISFLFN